MKIALLNIQYYPNIEGGAEISVQKLAESLAANNEVFIICDGQFNGYHNKHNNVTVIRMPARIKFNNKIERILTRSFKVQCYKQIVDILKYIKPDVLHTNNLHAFSVIVWKAAFALNIPVIHTLRDYTLLQTVRKFEYIINRRYSNKVDIVTAPSQFTLNKFLDNKFFFDSRMKVSIPNAIDFSEELLDEYYDLKISRNREVVKYAYIGRYHPDKGVDWLIESFNTTDYLVELHLFGKGELKDQSIGIIESDTRIFEHGFLNENDLMRELKDIDIIIVPSLWDEPFGRTIIDGYKCICPVIITNRGGMPEVVDHSRTGLILPDETTDSLVRAIHYFSDRDNIKEMIPYVRRKIIEFSIQRQTKQFLELYSVCSTKVSLSN